jgi:hypothetical protein
MTRHRGRRTGCISTPRRLSPEAGFAGGVPGSREGRSTAKTPRTPREERGERGTNLIIIFEYLYNIIKYSEIFAV